jgi:hypothetical protein
MGEAIIFRLGMRVLSAVEALLPSSAGAPREQKTSDAGDTSIDRGGKRQQALQPNL